MTGTGKQTRAETAGLSIAFDRTVGTDFDLRSVRCNVQVMNPVFFLLRLCHRGCTRAACAQRASMKMQLSTRALEHTTNSCSMYRCYFISISAASILFEVFLV